VERPFDPSAVVLPCDACRAPVAAASDDAPLICACGAQVPVPPRPRVAVRAPSVVQDPALAAQAGELLTPPPSIASLFRGNELPAHRRDEAWLAWQHARRQATAGDVGAGDAMVFLGRELATTAGFAGRPLEARALLEATWRAGVAPRQRAVAAGAWARAALRSGDVDAAARCLERIEVDPAVLEMDSEWRVSTAMVRAAQGDDVGVLELLGSKPGERIIPVALLAQAVVFRAHALERRGDRAGAERALASLLQQGGGAARDAIERIRLLHPDLDLCRDSWGAVLAAHEAGARRWAGCGRLALAAVLAGSAILPTGLMGAFAVGQLVWRGLPRHWSGWAEALVPLVITAVVSVPFLLWGLSLAVMGLRERWAVRRGVRARAQVVGVRPTGTQVNDQPELALTLAVETRPPVESTLRMVVPVHEVGLWRAGVTVWVRVDPQRPATAVLDR